MTPSTAEAPEPLPAPRTLKALLPLTTERESLVVAARRDAASILRGADPRLLVIVGPCSAHDTAATLEYAERLADLARRHADALQVIQRVYVEKPRTVGGWKGLVNDPRLDGSHRLAEGLERARGLMLGVLDAGLPVATEFLEPLNAAYLADAVSWGAIGARTTESQPHRQLASALPLPIGFKNTSDGGVQPAVDACRAAALRHVVTGIDEEGRVAAVPTAGNRMTHVVLRGGHRGPNHDADSVREARALLDSAGVENRLVVDASHGNSGKDHVRQAEVAEELAGQVAAGGPVAGVMLESFLEPGRQDLTDAGPAGLAYGRSITDACLGWDETERLLGVLADSSRARMRAVRSSERA